MRKRLKSSTTDDQYVDDSDSVLTKQISYMINKRKIRNKSQPKEIN